DGIRHPLVTGVQTCALPISEIERNRVSTVLIPAAVARVLRATPALARPRAKAKYFVIVFTDRRWLNDLSRHKREAERTIGGGREIGRASCRHRGETRAAAVA